MSEKEYELIEILKNGICPHTGKRYNCLRCDGAKPHDLMNQGVHIVHCGFAVKNSFAGFNDPLTRWNKLASVFTIPFEDGSFRMVVFDPPHLIRAGEKSWLAQKYGKLDKETWRDDLKQGFNECFRVLEPGGFLIFKWNEDQVKVTEVSKLFPVQPLFGQRGGKTHWLVFMKEGAGE